MSDQSHQSLFVSMPVPQLGQNAAATSCSHCRVLSYVKLRFVSWHDTKSLFIAEVQHFLQGISADAEVLR